MKNKINVGAVVTCSKGIMGLVQSISTLSDGRSRYRGVCLTEKPGRPFETIQPTLVAEDVGQALYRATLVAEGRIQLTSGPRGAANFILTGEDGIKT